MANREFEDEITVQLVGKRFLDTKRDISFTVVGYHKGPPDVTIELDDGRCCHPKQHGSLYDEIFPPDRATAYLRLQRAGVEDGRNDDRFSLLGEGPTLHRSQELCSDEGHTWSILPDEIWPDTGRFDNDARRIYRRVAKCVQCGLSGATLNEISGEKLPWWCENCEKVFPDDELTTLPPEYLMLHTCSDCASKLS